MNSSGIKRGLATTAVSALAIAGLPLFASSASADVANNAEIKVVSVTNVRNAGTYGGQVVLNVKGIWEDVVAPGNANNVRDAGELPDQAKFLLRAENPADGSEDKAGVQDLDLKAASVIADGANGDTTKNDGFDTVVLRVAATTQQVGDTAKFSVIYDEANAGTYNLGEPFVKTAVTTVGAPTTFALSPASQTGALNQAVDYNARLTDAAGRPTQLNAGETVALTSDTGAVDFNTATGALDANGALTAADLITGSATVTVAGTTTVVHTITGDPTEAGVSNGTAKLDVLKGATISNTEVDFVTGADSWDGFGGDTFGNGVLVRVDQPSITVNIKGGAADAGGTVPVTVSSANGITFGGKTSQQFLVTLNGDSVGSFTITPDAGTIADGRTISVKGFDADTTIAYAIARVNNANTKTDAGTYISSYTGTVSPKVTVRDQFGNPVSGVWVSVQRTGGANADASPSARKQTGADGTVSFDLTSTKATATNNTKDDLVVRVYPNEFSAAGDFLVQADKADIVYTADGKGSEFSLRGDNIALAGAAYDPKSVFAEPLTDAKADTDANEYIKLDVTGGTGGAPVTISVDGGAKVIDPAATPSVWLSDGKDSISTSLDNGGAKTFRIVGTKTGTVNVTVTSGGFTKTSQVTIRAAAAPVARNVALTGPTAATSGSTAVFVAKVTDAFGNPVPGFGVGGLSIQVAGPARLQGTDAVTDANGELKINVALDSDADAPVTVSVLATGGQFGANANSTTAAPGDANNARGLTASVRQASAQIAEVTDLAALEQAVADAEKALADAEDALAAAQGNLDVAQTELAVAQANVDTLKAKKAKLRKKLNKAKANDNKQKAKTTRKKLRAVKRNLSAAQDQVTIATAKVAAAQGVVDNRTEDVAEAQADLDQAEQNLEDAQNG
jgi:hypothetical protein